jgi:pimeloyl-ACP methyl ester carboxylesterase
MSTELYYETHGEGPEVVFAHGLGGNHASWFQQVPFFARFFRVVIFDHRGFGNSRNLEGGPDRSRFVDDLKGLLDHLQIARAALVAQSMGGGTCVGFTRKYPERVGALVLADTLVGIKLPETLQPRMEAVRRTTADLSQLERVLSSGFRDREPVLTHLYTEINNFNLGVRDNVRGTFGEGVTVEELTKTRVPILFLVGGEDILFPPDVVRGVQRMIPGSHYLEVPGAGHSVYFENPNGFNERVLDFLKASKRLG